jgi:hypothetical protein
MTVPPNVAGPGGVRAGAAGAHTALVTGQVGADGVGGTYTRGMRLEYVDASLREPSAIGCQPYVGPDFQVCGPTAGVVACDTVGPLCDSVHSALGVAHSP